MTNFLRFGAAAALVAALAAPAMAAAAVKPGGGMGTDVSPNVAPRVTGTVGARLAADPRFSVLVRALRSSGLEMALEGSQPVTLFAPTNAAFAALPPALLADLLKPESQARLQAVLQGHLLLGRVPAAAIADGRLIRSLSGTDLAFNRPAGGGGGLGQPRPAITVSGARIVEPDLPAANGLIHVVDRVILPQALLPR